MNKERGIILAGNWKMNQTQTQTRAFISELKKKVTEELTDDQKKFIQSKKIKAHIFPSFLSLDAAQKEVADFSALQIGSQNTHWKESGAFTGEVSTQQLKEIGVNLSLVGHSERREFFGETDETVEKRARFLLEQGFEVILCIGETLKEREQGKTFEVLAAQLKRVCSLNVVFAYEPVWAIGTGKTATPAQAEEAHLFIRNFIHQNVSSHSGARACLLYGGSVKPENFKELLSQPNIDGALVGGASLKAADFFSMWRTALGFYS